MSTSTAVVFALRFTAFWDRSLHPAEMRGGGQLFHLSSCMCSGINTLICMPQTITSGHASRRADPRRTHSRFTGLVRPSSPGAPSGRVVLIGRRGDVTVPGQDGDAVADASGPCGRLPGPPWPPDPGSRRRILLGGAGPPQQTCDTPREYSGSNHKLQGGTNGLLLALRTGCRLHHHSR